MRIGVQWPEREADHAPLSYANVKNACNNTSTPPLYLHGVYRDSFNFLFSKGKGKGHPCTGTEALYRPYGP